MGLINTLREQSVYFDTNIIIYLVEGFSNYQSALDDIHQLFSEDDIEAVTSELTFCEVLVKPFKIQSVQGITLYQTFLEESGVFKLIPVSRDILIKTASVEANTSMKTPDAIHVATALDTHCDLLLTNDQHIKTLNGLKKVLLSDYK